MKATIRAQALGATSRSGILTTKRKEPERLSKFALWRREHPEGILEYVDWRAANK